MVITSGKKYLIDTNILAYYLDTKSPFYKQAGEVINKALDDKFKAVIAGQNLVELANVLHRDYQISLSDIRQNIEKFTLDFEVIMPLKSTLIIFNELLTQKNYKKLPTFDLYLAATVIDNKIDGIITANDKDFLGIKDLLIYNPF